MRKLCSSLKSVLLSLLFVFLCLFLQLLHPLTASAASVQISSFGVSALQPNGSAYSVIENVYYNQYISFNGVPPEAIKLYRFDTDVLAISGNFANIHFETNIVFSQPTSLPYIANFVNRGYISVLRCSTSDGASLVINSSSVSSHVTEWTGAAPVINGKNKTLTVYGDVTVSGLTSGNKRISCAVGSDTYAIYQTSSPTNLPNVYIEQQPTSIDFTNNQSEALLNTQIEQNNTIINNQENIINAINSQSENEKSEYEDQAQDVQDDLDDANSASVQQGATLISMLTQFFTTIRDSNPTTYCEIYLDLRLYGSERFNLNLCQPRVKTFLQYTRTPSPSISSTGALSIWGIISTVVFSCLIVGLVIQVLNRIKKVYEEFRK